MGQEHEIKGGFLEKAVFKLGLEGQAEMKGKDNPKRNIIKSKHTNSLGKWSPALL